MKCNAADPPGDFLFSAMISCAIIIFALPIQFLLAYIFDTILFFKPDWSALWLCSKPAEDELEEGIDGDNATKQTEEDETEFDIVVKKGSRGIGLGIAQNLISESFHFTEVLPNLQIIKSFEDRKIEIEDCLVAIDGVRIQGWTMAETIKKLSELKENSTVNLTLKRLFSTDVNKIDHAVGGLTLDEEVDYIFESATVFLSKPEALAEETSEKQTKGLIAQIPSMRFHQASLSSVLTQY